ncbi:MAG TPA: sigma-70 family RNA polymerase sigma factor [Thermomicrobiales bacterium]|nr:sigma-70 family RNA polymerase sigma factor [Thermomicrobiales bacterium]
MLFLFSLRLRLSGGRGEDQHEGEPDAALIERARGGDLPAFNQLVERHERAVYNVALRYMRSRELAEDVTQEAFLRAWRSLESFRNDAGEGFRAWLLRIASNRALDVLRAKARRPADSLDRRLDDDESTWEPEGDDEAPLDFAVRDDLGTRLEHALGRLHPDQRLVVILSDIHGHPYDEIAEIAGVPVGTVKSRINRGRARLRDLLLADDGSRELLGARARLESGDGRD